MNNTLLVIDYQNDFVSENGTLTLGAPARKIDLPLAKYIKQTNTYWDDIYFTKDVHYSKGWLTHPESKLFPMHCEEGTFGADLYGATGNILRNIGQGIAKTSYGLDQIYIKLLISHSDTITVCGVATDICVLQNAIALYNENIYRGTNVVLKLADEYCAGTTPENHTWAINYMLNTLGMKRV